MRKYLFLLTAVLMLFCVTACGVKLTFPPSATQGDAAGEPLSGKTASVYIYADFSAGNPETEKNNLIRSKTVDMVSPPDIKALADALSEWSGLDFSLADARIDGNRAYVDWSADSTLVAGLGERVQKEDFRFYDAVSLNWFMMDSLARTIKENLQIEEVCYSMDGGKELAFQNPDDMAAAGLASLPTDQPYEGSAIFASHAGEKGNDTENTNVPGEGTGDKTDDDDLPYWNGINFGPNVEYGEEYTLGVDRGDYPNAAEGAKLTFDAVREGGNVPDYSDGTKYTIVLVGLEDIEGEECYVYRLDPDEPTGTAGAAYAYAYKSGNVYMQGQGSQWVIVHNN